jgi:DNA-binding transcriptional LysR family regulator
MELSWLEDFLTLAEAGNFSRAAEQRNLTQPAFSRRIRALEEWLGAPLIDRSSHPVGLTESGRLFRLQADDILGRLATAREEAQASAQAGPSTLHLVATHALSLTFLPAWLRSIEARRPTGPIQLVSDSLEACEDWMLQRHAQFMICHHHPEVVSRLDDSMFESALIGADALIPVSAPIGTNGTRAARFKLPDDDAKPAQRLPMLVYSPQSGLGRIIRARGGGRWRQEYFETVFTAHLAAVLKAMALEGRGIAWLPKSLIGDELNRHALVEAGGAAWHIPLEIRLFRRRSPSAPQSDLFWSLVT